MHAIAHASVHAIVHAIVHVIVRAIVRDTVQRTCAAITAFMQVVTAARRSAVALVNSASPLHRTRSSAHRQTRECKRRGRGRREAEEEAEEEQKTPESQLPCGMDDPKPASAAWSTRHTCTQMYDSAGQQPTGRLRPGAAVQPRQQPTGTAHRPARASGAGAPRWRPACQEGRPAACTIACTIACTDLVHNRMHRSCAARRGTLHASSGKCCRGTFRGRSRANFSQGRPTCKSASTSLFASADTPPQAGASKGGQCPPATAAATSA